MLNKIAEGMYSQEVCVKMKLDICGRGETTNLFVHIRSLLSELAVFLYVSKMYVREYTFLTSHFAPSKQERVCALFIF